MTKMKKEGGKNHGYHFVVPSTTAAAADTAAATGLPATSSTSNTTAMPQPLAPASVALPTH